VETGELLKRAEKLLLECLTFVDEEGGLWKEIWGWMLDFDSLEMERKSIPTLGGREGDSAPSPSLSGGVKFYQLTPGWLYSIICLTLIYTPFYGWRIHYTLFDRYSGFLPPL